MTHRTVVLSSIEEYLSYIDAPVESIAKYKAELNSERNLRLLRFPHAVMLQVSYAELDFANRWCWTRFGPCDGLCLQRDSEYRVCRLDQPHSHEGVWTSDWFEKTDYNFGFNEWYFSERSHFEAFLAFVPAINWGENFPK